MAQFEITYEGKTTVVEARTPEGVVKKYFANLGKQIPRANMNDWSWKGVTIRAKNEKRVDPYKLPPFTWKYDQESKQWVKA